MAHVFVDDTENLEKAIKRFKRMVEKEGIIREFKKREYYEKPSTIKNRQNKTMRRKLMKRTHKPHEISKTAVRNDSNFRSDNNFRNDNN
jgi:small subunit ribosomal protein S21